MLSTHRMEVKTVEGAPGTARRLVLSGSVGLGSVADLRERLDEACVHGAVELDLGGIGDLTGGAAAVIAPRVKSGSVRMGCRPCWIFTLIGRQSPKVKRRRIWI